VWTLPLYRGKVCARAKVTKEKQKIGVDIRRDVWYTIKCKEEKKNKFKKCIDKIPKVWYNQYIKKRNGD